MGPIAAKPTLMPPHTIAGLMLAQPALYDRLHRFQHLASTEMHPSWYAAFFPAPVAHLLEAGKIGRGSAHRWLSQHVASRLAPMAELDVVAEPAAAVALLEPERLWRLVQHCTAVLAGSVARSVLAGPDVSSWRKALSLELYAWGLERAPLLVSTALAEVVAARVPRESSAAQHVDQSNVIAVLLMRKVSAVVPGLWERLRLKLPRPLARAADESQLDDLPVAAERLPLRVLREIEPLWYSSFASQAA